MTYPWEHALDFLKADGWNYRLVEVAEPVGSNARQRVEISRNGLRYAASAPTLDEAVGALYGIATMVQRIQQRSLH